MRFGNIENTFHYPPLQRPNYGAAANPHFTTISGQDGLDWIEAAYSIKDGDYAVIDSGQDAVIFRASVDSGVVTWIRPYMYEGEDWDVDTIDTINSDNYTDWTHNGNGTVDFDSTVADRIALSNTSGSGTLTLLSPTNRPTKSDSFFFINERAKFDTSPIPSATLLRNQVNSTSGGIRCQVDGDVSTTEWSLEVTIERAIGVTFDTEKTIEVYSVGADIDKMLVYVDREAVPSYASNSENWNWDSTSIAKLGYLSLTGNANHTYSFLKGAYGKLVAKT